MKKLVKILVGIVLAVVALVVVAILTLPIWLGPVVKPVVNTAVPKITQTKFNLGILSLNPYTGRFEIGELLLGNPAGYDEPRALELKKLVVDLNMKTLNEEYIHIQEVTIDGVFASYVSAKGVNNFDQIQYNAAGGKEKYEAKKAKAEAEKKAKAEAKDAQKKETKVETAEAETPKFVIDRLTINDIKFKYGPLTLPVPSLTLTDLGKKSDGVTLAEIGDQIMQAVVKSAGALGDFAGEGAKLLGTGAGKAADAVSSGAKLATDAVSAGAKKTTEVVGDGAKKVSESVGSAASAIGADKAVNAVGDGAKKVSDGASNAAGKAVDAASEGAKKVGEGAKKAADALKSLF